MSELSKRYEELAGKFADALDDLVPTDDATIDLKELAKLAAESVLRDSLPALKKEWEREALERAAQLIDKRCDAMASSDSLTYFEIERIAESVRALARED